MTRETGRPAMQRRTTTMPAHAAAVLLAAAGCTICPDPLDYSGPVPGGSASQNDFRARANGIAPVGGVQRPWPPVVQAGPAADPAADESPAPVRTVAAEAPAANDAPPPPNTPSAAEPALDDILPATPPRRHEAVPPSLETPGWRPRG